MKVDPRKLETVQTFCDESSVHGIQYLAPSRHCANRTIWILLLAVAIGIAGSVVSTLLTNWDEHPIVTTIDTTTFPVQKIPFPAVTVCTNRQYDQWAFFQKVLNSVKVNNDVIDYFWEYLSYKIKFVKQAAEFEAASHGQDYLRESIGAMCNKVVNRKRCVTMKLMYVLSTKGRGFYAYSQIFKGLKRSSQILRDSDENVIKEQAYPILKSIIIDENITCEDCFSFEDSNGNFDFMKSIEVSRDFADNIVPTGRTIPLEQCWKLVKVIKAITNASLEYVGTAATRHFYEPEHDYGTELLKRLSGAPLPENATYFSLASAWSNFQEESLGRIDHLAFKCTKQTDPTDHYPKPWGCPQVSFKTVLTIMKDNIFQPHAFDLNYLFEQNFTGSIKHFRSYPHPITQNLTVFPLKQFSKRDWGLYANLQPFIPFCQLANSWSDPPKWGSEFLDYRDAYYSGLSEFCTLFRPSLTDHGICYTYNGVKSESLFENSEYLEAYKEVFGLPEDAYSTKPFYANGIRIQNGIRLVLDAHTLTGNFKEKPRTDNTFTISLQYPTDFPLPVTEGLEIKGGFKTSLVVTPQILESSDEIVDLPVERRSCKFITEPNTLGMFKTYAHKSCIFECMYKNAKDWCGCVPWSYPTFGNGSNLCDIYGNLCFAYQMTNGTHLTTCDCQNECNKISYTYFTNLQELKPSDCKRPDNGFQRIAEYIKTNQYGPLLHYKYYNVIRDLRKGAPYPMPSMVCEERLVKDIAIVDIYYGSQFATKLNKGLTATFTDKLASIGGTLGLFCGVSLLSIAEFLIFFVRAWLKAIRQT